MLAGQDREARKIYSLRLQFTSSSSVLHLPVIITCKIRENQEFISPLWRAEP